MGMNSRPVGEERSAPRSSISPSPRLATINGDNHSHKLTSEDQLPHGTRLEATHDGEGERAKDGTAVDSRSEGDKAGQLVSDVRSHTTRESEEH